MFIYKINEWLFTGIIFTCLAIAYYGGFKFGKKKSMIKSPNHGNLVFAELTGLFGFLGILLAFTFSMSSQRYESRKQLIVQESLDIGTSYFRIGLVPDTTLRREIRKLLYAYLDYRIELYTSGNFQERIEEASVNSENLQIAIWAKAANLGRESPNINNSLIIQSLNSMIDTAGDIYGSVYNHVPGLIIIILIIVAIITLFTLGYAHGFYNDMNWIFSLSVILIISLVLLLIIDMDSPITGILKVDVSTLIDLRKQIDAYDNL